MTKRKLYAIIVAVLVTINLLGSQVAFANGECVRNCPTPDAIIIMRPPSE